jgi:hypothetical protein
MRYDPAMSRYLRERLKTADLSRGLTLDGYPATLVQAEDLAKMLPDLKLKLIALRLQVPDDIIRKRAQTTGRQSDRPEVLEQRIKDYNREIDSGRAQQCRAQVGDQVRTRTPAGGAGRSAAASSKVPTSGGQTDFFIDDDGYSHAGVPTGRWTWAAPRVPGSSGAMSARHQDENGD